MERVYRKLILGLGVVGLITAIPARADTVLLHERPAPKQNSAEVFPPSRFGQPPMRVNTGISEDYAATEVSRWDRAPAGEEFGGRGHDRLSAEPARDLASVGPQLAVPTPESQLMEIRKKGVQEVALIAGDLGFFPKTFFVSRDVPVRLFVTGASKHTLCIMMDSFQIRKQVRSQKIEEITFTPNLPGQYRFYCPVNGMEGTMVVKELSGAAQ
jgi:plastocyanin